MFTFTSILWLLGDFITYPKLIKSEPEICTYSTENLLGNTRSNSTYKREGKPNLYTSEQTGSLIRDNKTYAGFTVAAQNVAETEGLCQTTVDHIELHVLATSQKGLETLLVRLEIYI